MDIRPPDYPAGDLRVSDAERDRAVSELSEHFQAGRLTLDEFQDRSGQALAARTGRELRHLFTDLPHRSAPLMDRGPVTPGVNPVAARNRAHGFRIAVALPVLICVAIAAAAGGNQGPHPMARLLVPLFIVLIVAAAVRRGVRRV